MCSCKCAIQRATLFDVKMISIRKATESDSDLISSIGSVSVLESHRESSPPEIMSEFLERNYNAYAIRQELHDPNNIYYMIDHDGQPAGFSKIILNARHPTIAAENVTKLDRIYLLKEFYGLKLGLELLNFNIDFSKKHDQSGMWLYAWVGNRRAIDFYLKAGFVIIGHHKYFVTETHYDESHLMFLDFNDPKASL